MIPVMVFCGEESFVEIQVFGFFISIPGFWL